jgi:hypothetical protein
MWRNVINGLEKDPLLRKRYQCWLFSYPAGNPPLYSALRLREELARVQQLYPKTRNYVLVGHSMGGFVSRMPAPHGACELPQTLDEMRRILHRHLRAPTFGGGR